MPISYGWPPEVGMLSVETQETVPTVWSPAFTSAGVSAAQFASAAPVARSTNETFAVVMFPAKLSGFGAEAVGSTGVMSLIVADRVTVALEAVVEDAKKRLEPV